MFRAILIATFFFFTCLSGCSGDTSNSQTTSAATAQPTATPSDSPSATPSDSPSATPSDAPTPSPSPTALTHIDSLFDGFENGWGNYLDGGLFTSLSTDNAYAGISSVKLEGNYGAASTLILRSPLDLSQAQSLEISFWMFGQDLADGDTLDVEFSDGSQWLNVSRQTKGETFGNGQYSQVTIQLSKDDYVFSQIARIRATSNTQKNPIFIDDISLTTEILDTEDTPTNSQDDNYSFDHAGVTDGCSGCHNNLIATGKSASHIASSDECELCHIPNNPKAWLAFSYVSGSYDHTGVIDHCFSCHNNQVAVGKGPLHIDSSLECQFCHSPSQGWTLMSSNGGFNHENITTSCMNCHNGDIATGKSDTHIVSSDACENCHDPEKAWSNVDIFDHEGIVDNCVSCHNGESAEGKKAFHIPSSDNCEQCHSPTNGWWLAGVDNFDHGSISSGCVACHNGTIVSGKSSNHIASGDACENCHIVGGKWNQVEVFSHQGITDNCISCHNNTDAQGKDAFHIASSDNCETCHLPDQGWLIDIGTGFTHENIVSGCLSCHNNVTATGKGSNHIDSNDRCESCHDVGNNWDVSTFSHEGIVGQCVSCHDGSIATGKSTGHVSSPDLCENCHKPNDAWLFEVVTTPFSHDGIDSSCISCHNGTISQGKSTNHIPSDNQCQSCHNKGGSWSDAKFSHTGITSGCASCHNGSVASGKNASHIGSSSNCETCHLPDDGWLVSMSNNFDHFNVNSDCVTCHDGSIATGKTSNHIPSNNACENCHTPGGLWSSATFNHDGITSGCSSCHNGNIATGMSASHFVTTQACESCHVPSGWQSTDYTHASSSAYPGDHRAALSCTHCHTDNQEDVPWPFPTLANSCAGCHSNDYKSGPHKGATVADLKNCAGTCHKSTPEHSVLDRSFD